MRAFLTSIAQIPVGVCFALIFAMVMLADGMGAREGMVPVVSQTSTESTGSTGLQDTGGTTGHVWWAFEVTSTTKCAFQVFHIKKGDPVAVKFSWPAKDPRDNSAHPDPNTPHSAKWKIIHYRYIGDPSPEDGRQYTDVCMDHQTTNCVPNPDVAPNVYYRFHLNPRRGPKPWFKSGYLSVGIELHEDDPGTAGGPGRSKHWDSEPHDELAVTNVPHPWDLYKNPFAHEHQYLRRRR